MKAFLRVGLALTLAVVTSGARAEGPERRIIQDAEGRSLRVGFDLGSRWLFGASVDPRTGTGHFEHALLVRERDDEGIRWKLDHAFLEGAADTHGGWSATLYHGLFLRNSGDGSLVIPFSPTAPPLRIVLPADLGFEVALGSVARTPGEHWTVGVARADLLFDFWRAETAGSYLALRTGMAYELAGETAFAHVQHVVTPFSRVGLDLMHTFDSGRQVVLVQAALSHRMVVARDATAWSNLLSAHASWEGIVLAIDDAPVSVLAELGFDRDADRDVLRATIGLRVGVPTD
ncbi:MAG: hypothetical protein JNJ59_17050 [Deltaproteobacteria bacterium]|nr:hypothetical protein [Deltaproteobacteria bacterium]